MRDRTVALLIEDNPADSQLLIELVEVVMQSGRLTSPIVWEIATSLKKGLSRLSAGGIDIVLLDLMLPDSQGLGTFQKAFALNLGTPFVIISGQDDENMALEAVHQGAQDYLVKDDLSGILLIRTMLYAIERKGTEQALQESEAMYRDLVETSQDLIFRCDTEGRFTYLNPAWTDSHGYRLDEMINHSFKEFVAPETVNREMQEFNRLLKGGSVMSLDKTHISKSVQQFISFVKRNRYGTQPAISSVSRGPLGTLLSTDFLNRKLLRSKRRNETGSARNFMTASVSISLETSTYALRWNLHWRREAQKRQPIWVSFAHSWMKRLA